MPWLTHSQDEVKTFHPAFLAAANDALKAAGMDQDYEWKHHSKTPGVSVIPDFVLCKKAGGQWILAFELKRTPEAVISTRNQIQAQGYASHNQTSYPPSAPRYFAISNLEITRLFALNGNRPPGECLLEDGKFDSGRFEPGTATTHRNQFIADLVQMLKRVTSPTPPAFDLVWNSVLQELVSYADNLPTLGALTVPEPTSSNWPVVKDYFSRNASEPASVLFFLRCLMAEYLRGTLLRHHHPKAAAIPALRPLQGAASVATTMAELRTIDFHALFEDFAPNFYRTLTDPSVKQQIQHYVNTLTDPGRRIVDLAMSRVDSIELIETLMTTICPVEDQGDRGKVQTDPELAQLLAWLCIREPGKTVLDPCCGDGALLTAGYDRLVGLGLNQPAVLAAVAGMEADPVAMRLAALRLALKQPATLTPALKINVQHGDMFADPQAIGSADVILMNPPFKRYESQDQRPLPPQLRAHYNQAITAIDGQPPVATKGQANLFAYYVEFVVKAAKAGAVIGLILDNKWYHNQYGEPLRQLLLTHCDIEAVIDYPHSAFFQRHAIATSIVVVRKVATPNPDQETKFIRAKVDPRGADLQQLVTAVSGNGAWPVDWTHRAVKQAQLTSKVGWKNEFGSPLTQDFRAAGLPLLPELFAGGRRGSLDKEGGGISVFEFPFGRNDYGPKRKAVSPRRRFQTQEDGPLTLAQNQALASLAAQIPDDYRGYALKNVPDADRYELEAANVTRQMTLEAPSLRAQYAMFRSDRRSGWRAEHAAALTAMEQHPQVGAYLKAIGTEVGLTQAVLPNEERLIVLQEPVAGELIIPRKTRTGHRVFLNPFALTPSGRQVRISSNFVTYRDSVEDAAAGLDRKTSATLVAAFLMSSFGQLQSEMEGYNREGMLAVEKAQLDRIRVFDPRWVRPHVRQAILNAFAALPFPVATDRLSSEQPERNALDDLFADEICAKYSQFSKESLLTEVHAALDEWLLARQPDE